MHQSSGHLRRSVRRCWARKRSRSMNLTHLAAGHPVAGTHLSEVRTDPAAAGDRDRATRMKHAARRRIDRARLIRSEPAAGLDARIRRRYSVEKGPGMGVDPCGFSRSPDRPCLHYVVMTLQNFKRRRRSVGPMSALPPKADIDRACWDVRFVPKADSCTAT